MKKFIARVTIANYQIGDIAEILLANNYTLNLTPYDGKRIHLDIFEESEENDD